MPINGALGVLMKCMQAAGQQQTNYCPGSVFGVAWVWTQPSEACVLPVYRCTACIDLRALQQAPSNAVTGACCVLRSANAIGWTCFHSPWLCCGMLSRQPFNSSHLVRPTDLPIMPRSGCQIKHHTCLGFIQHYGAVLC